MYGVEDQASTGQTVKSGRGRAVCPKGAITIRITIMRFEGLGKAVHVHEKTTNRVRERERVRVRKSRALAPPLVLRVWLLLPGLASETCWRKFQSGDEPSVSLYYVAQVFDFCIFWDAWQVPTSL